MTATLVRNGQREQIEEFPDGGTIWIWYSLGVLSRKKMT